MTTYLMPFNASAPVDLGRLWRKQVLKIGRVNANGTPLDITPEYCADLAQAFNEGAYDQVPFQLVGGDNAHPDTYKDDRYAPENFRGEVKAFEVTPDGLDMIMEPSPKGAELLRENPHLGVSPRLVPNYTRSDGKRWRAAIEHIAGTLNPVVTGMRPWAVADLSSADGGDVIDLSMEEVTMADEPTQQDAAEVSDAAGTTLQERLSAEELQQLREMVAAELLAEIGEEEDAEPELATANLSAEAQAALDLSNANAEQARTEAAAIRAELDTERADREAANYINAGVKPALVNLSRPALTGAAKTIDLSNGEKADLSQIVRTLLDELKGSVDLSGRAKGHTEDEAEDSGLKAAREGWQQ